MSDRENLVALLEAAEDAYLDKLREMLLSPERANLVQDAYGFYADHLIARGVKIQKHGRWILHKHGKATCDQCRFTQENVWDYDRWQRYCGVCGALMDGESDGR